MEATIGKFLNKTDIRSDQFFMINGPITGMFAYFIAIVILVQIFIKIRFNEKTIKPAIMILCGYLFGNNFVGILFAIWLSEGGVQFFNCSILNEQTMNVREYFTVYCCYIVFWIKLIDSVTEMLPYLIRSQKPIPPLLLIVKIVLNLTYSYLLIRMHPGGLVWFTLSIDLVVSSIEGGYRTLLTASSEMRPHKKTSKIIYSIKFAQYSLMFLHSVYLLAFGSCNHVKEVLRLQLTYAFLNMALLPHLPDILSQNLI